MKLFGTLLVLVLVASIWWFGLGLRFAPFTGSQMPEQAAPGSSSAAVVAEVEETEPDVDAEPIAADEMQAMTPLPPASEPAPVAPFEPILAPIATVDESEPLPAAPDSANSKNSEPAPAAAVPVAPQPTDSPAPAPTTVAAEGLAMEDASVFVFWKPFYSRTAASGFAANLQARSDVTVNVVEEPRIGGRQYRVALPFRSEAERLQSIKSLEDATRLRIE